MNIQKYLLLPIVFGVAAFSAQAQLLDDTFTSGTTGAFKTTSTLTNIAGIGTQSPPSSAEWFGIGSSSTSSITYNTGVGIKSATTTPSNSQGVISYFEAPGSQVSLNVGDTITESMNFQFATAPTNVGFGLHMLLLNSNSTGTQNNQTLSELGTTTVAGNVAATNYSGFYVQFDPHATNTGIDSIFERPTGSVTSWVGSNTNSTPLNTSTIGTASTPVLGTDLYKAVLTINYTNATTETLGFNILDLTTGGTDVAAYDLSGLTTTSLITSFDTFAIGLGTAGPVTISEASVVDSAVAIPEPSTYAAILGAATLGLVALRSRRQRRMSVA
jgi:hypothetical protein